MQGKQQKCVAGFSVLVVISAYEAAIFCVSSVPTVARGQNNEWLGQGEMARQVSRLLVVFWFFFNVAVLTHAKIKQC